MGGAKKEKKLTIGAPQERIAEEPDADVGGVPGAEEAAVAVAPDEVGVADAYVDGFTDAAAAAARLAGGEGELDAAVARPVLAGDGVAAAAVGLGAGEGGGERAHDALGQQRQRRAGVDDDGEGQRGVEDGL